MLLSEISKYNNIKIGNLYLPPQSVSNYCANCVRMMIFENTDYPSYLGRGGSVTLFKIQGRKYAGTARHTIFAGEKLLNREILETVRIHSQSGEFLKNIPVNRTLYVTSQNGEEFEDIIAFGVAEDHFQDNIDSPYFFPCSFFDNRERNISYLYGYPTFSDVMKYNPQRIDMIQYLVDVKIDQSHKTANQHFRRYIIDREKVHFDGLSGGAIFSLVGNIGSYEMVLDGIVVRAGGKYVYIVDADFLMKLCK